MFRKDKIEIAKNTYYDVIIIGGGITGAGIMLKAVQRGLKVLLVEKNDFASGTSSRSSKLVHGGLRYLAHMQINLVYEGLHEREHLLKAYPHLVSPQPFFMPVYHKWVDRLKFSVGLTGYDMLQGKSIMPRHVSIAKEDIILKYPQIVHQDLKGGFHYFDARTNDARLTNEVIQDSEREGGVAINYIKVTKFKKKNHNIESIEVLDTFTGEKFNLSAKIIVSATGVWTDETMQMFDTKSKPIMKPSKGVHVVVSGDFLPKNDVLILPSIEGDGRFLWCVPWEDNLNVIGTTDTNFEEDKDALRVTSSEVKYLLDSVNKYLQGEPIKETDILSVYAGLRPLLDDDDAEDSTERSRDFEILWSNENLVTIAGGKLTSFMHMAEKLVLAIEDTHPEMFSDYPTKYDLVKDIIPTYPMYQQLRKYYGDRNTALIKKIIDEDESLGYRFDIKYKYLKAEIIFFIRHQNAVTLDDVLTRRTLISYNMKEWDEKLLQNVCILFQRELHWNESETASQLERYRHAWEIMHTWH